MCLKKESLCCTLEINWTQLKKIKCMDTEFGAFPPWLTLVLWDCCSVFHGYK